MMAPSTVDVAVIGGGLVGLAVAHQLRALAPASTSIALVEPGKPGRLTSAASTGGYRNFYPADRNLTQLATRSIAILEEIARRTNNEIELRRPGYAFFSADPEQRAAYRQLAEAAQANGSGWWKGPQGADRSGAVRSGDYVPATGQWDREPDGVDLVGDDPALLRRHFPYITDRAVCLAHVRKAGFLHVERLSDWLFREAVASGVHAVAAALVGLDASAAEPGSAAHGYHLRLRHSDGSEVVVAARAVVLAVGPYLRPIGRLFGLDFPVVNEVHARARIRDPLNLFPQSAPFAIWSDPVVLPWTADERAAIEAEGERSRWLLEPIAPADHLRPLSDHESPHERAFLGIWTFETHTVDDPVYPVPVHPRYGEVVLRGLTAMIPAMAQYLEAPYRTADQITVQSGYYCKTAENLPLLGPAGPPGLFVCGALTGFGIMNSIVAAAIDHSQASAELVAMHVANHLSGAEVHQLPPYAAAFHPGRYHDPAFLARLAGASSRTGQL